MFKINNIKSCISVLILFGIFFAAEEPSGSSNLDRIGDYGFPPTPISDRAMGLLLQGKIKSAILNSGSFIDIDVDRTGTWESYPVALWGEYSYLPQVSFMAGVAGMKYAYLFNDWLPVDGLTVNSGQTKVWETSKGYYEWYELGDSSTAPVFAGIIFENHTDYKGQIGIEVFDITSFSDDNQYYIDYDAAKIYISLPNSVKVDPNNSNSYGEAEDKKSIGFVYPWAMRPKLENRNPINDYDSYNYGGCQDEGATWDECDFLDYYGATVSESQFKRSGFDLDWHPTVRSRETSHNLETTMGEVFGTTPYINENDEYPVLAHSNFSSTWPYKVNPETGENEYYWPGWFAESYIDTLPGCSGTKKDLDCWAEDYGRFVSDSDVYMQFDDRWAHWGNTVNTTNEYETKGYPMGLKVEATAHSYGVGFAEDIMFVTVKVRNESGDWTDEDGNFHEGIIMPDGTKLNGGKGFNYRDLSLGFYFDADVVTQDATGDYSGIHTNDDDDMSYLDTILTVNQEELIISMAKIFDYDGISATATDIGIVAVQLLDSPIATDTIWKGPNQDELFRIPGQKLKQTDWHWFNWYNRPGVAQSGASSNPTDAKEEIMYKVMVGDTVNLTSEQKQWYFHTSNPVLDSDAELDPHFDDLSGLHLEADWDDGLDCVLISSCGPFSLDVGEEVPFSFTVIFGESEEDLFNNAVFAQIMYNSHYQGYTPPAKPEVYAAVNHEKVVLHWDDVAEYSTDVITAYSDFEGYRIYKSTDKGVTWGGPEDMIFNDQGVHVGWKPIAQFDLSEQEDINHCIYSNETCSGSDARGIETSGPDPLAPWFDLGDNTGLKHVFVDTAGACSRCGVIDGVEYTYSVTAYDAGIEADYEIDWFSNTPDTTWVEEECTDVLSCSFYLSYFPDTTWSSSNPGHWSTPHGYQSIETSKGTTILDPNFVIVEPGYTSSNITFPGETVTDSIMRPSVFNMGTGGKYFEIVNYEDLDDNLYKFEINADLNDQYYNSNAIRNPMLYAYQISDEINQKPICCDYEASSFSEDSLLVLLDLPGVSLDSTTDIITIPDYVIEEHEIYSIDQAGYDDQWTPFISGLRFRMDNIPALAPFDDELTPLGLGEVSNADVDNFKAINDLEWSVSDSAWIEAITIKMGYRQTTRYPNGFNFDYEIEFGSNIDTSTFSGNNYCYDPDLNVDDDEYGSLLPFRIYNLNSGYCETFHGSEEDLIVNEELCCLDGLGTWDAGVCSDSDNTWYEKQKVDLLHRDNGLDNQEGSEGDADCVWTRREWMWFYKEKLDSDDGMAEVSMFTLYIDFNPYIAFPDLDIQTWLPITQFYEGDYVYYEGMVWRATADIPPTLCPCDSSEDNPWEVFYPWDEGDKVIVRTSKFFTDGDYWTIDFSQFGESNKTTKEDLEKIRVVPNPYIVNSRFNETQFERRLRFSRLPQECTINIFTITGERVNTIEHSDPYDGNAWWNIRTINNQEVAPGLYIYTVEVGQEGQSDYVKHIGKFAIVR